MMVRGLQDFIIDNHVKLQTSFNSTAPPSNSFFDKLHIDTIPSPWTINLHDNECAYAPNLYAAYIKSG